MSDPIERDEAIKLMNELADFENKRRYEHLDNRLAFHRYLHGECCYRRAADKLKKMPTVEAEPVRHGRWKEYGDYDDYGDTYECTSCGELFCMIEGTPIENGYDYCPKCGAKMDEVEHDKAD